MTVQTYKQLIMESLEDLPAETLSEITDFIYFIRQKALSPEIFKEEREIALSAHALKELNRSEQAHLEEEFQDYDRLYPRG